MDQRVTKEIEDCKDIPDHKDQTDLKDPRDIQEHKGQLEQAHTTIRPTWWITELHHQHTEVQDEGLIYFK